MAVCRWVYRQMSMGDKILKIRSSKDDLIFNQNTENDEKIRSGLASGVFTHTFEYY